MVPNSSNENLGVGEVSDYCCQCPANNMGSKFV
jgi:hypothetical protein